MFVGNLVVPVQLGNHRETDGQSDPIDGVQRGRVFIVCNDARTDIGNGHIAVVVDDGDLDGVANGFECAVTQIGVDDGNGGVGLLNEEIQRTVLQRAGHITVKFRVFDTPVLQTGCDK